LSHDTLYFSNFSLHTLYTTKIFTLSLHDALPISKQLHAIILSSLKMISMLSQMSLKSETVITLKTAQSIGLFLQLMLWTWVSIRSEEHTSELQSLRHLVCRLLLEKKKKKIQKHYK